MQVRLLSRALPTDYRPLPTDNRFIHHGGTESTEIGGRTTEDRGTEAAGWSQDRIKPKKTQRGEKRCSPAALGWGGGGWLLRSGNRQLTTLTDYRLPATDNWFFNRQPREPREKDREIVRRSDKRERSAAICRFTPISNRLLTTDYRLLPCSPQGTPRDAGQIINHQSQIVNPKGP